MVGRGEAPSVPALLTRRSSPPRSAAAATNCWRWCASVMSPGMTSSAASVVIGNRAAATAKALASRPSTTSDQPCWASPVASASPSPLDAPVTMATLMVPTLLKREVRSSKIITRESLFYFRTFSSGVGGVVFGPTPGPGHRLLPDGIEGVGQLGGELGFEGGSRLPE